MSDLFFGEDQSLLNNDEASTDFTFGDKVTEVPYEETLLDSNESSDKKTSEKNSTKKSSDDSDKKKEEPEEKFNLVKEILSWVRMIAVGIIVGILLVVFVVQRDDVHGESMFPNLVDGEVIFTEKISTYFNNYNRGDIVILDGHDMEGYNREEYLIKRIVALPGETIRITDGHVYIRTVNSDEFYLLEEPYLDPSVLTAVTPRGMEMGYDEYTLADNEYFCLGDNRTVSNDSRNLGPFTEDRIKGIAFIAVYPFELFGFL